VLALVPVSLSGATPSSPVCYADEAELRTELFEGVCEGTLLLEPKGGHGFGYDPLFVPAGHSLSFGELPEPVKNQISHRARALSKLQEWLRREHVLPASN
jgi:XTP/dITP diphosphohydrolase